MRETCQQILIKFNTARGRNIATNAKGKILSQDERICSEISTALEVLKAITYLKYYKPQEEYNIYFDLIQNVGWELWQEIRINRTDMGLFNVARPNGIGILQCSVLPTQNISIKRCYKSFADLLSERHAQQMKAFH
jgi:hypothetical protein